MFDGTSTHCAGSSPVLSLSISLRLLFEVTERCHGNWAGTRIKLRHWIFWVSGDNEINGRRSGMSTSPLSLSPPPPPPPKHTLPQAAVTQLYKHSPLPLPGKERCGRGGGEGGRGSCDPHVICPRNCRFNTGRAASPRRCKKWRERVISIHRVLNWFKSPVATRLPVVGNMTVVKVPHYLSPPPPPHSPFTGFPDLHSLEGRCGAVERSQVNEDQLPVY